MTDLRKAARQALWALQYHVEMTWPIDRTSEAIFNLRAALAQQQAGSWQDGVLEGHLRERERWLAQEQAEPKGGGRLPPPLQAEPDLSLCPQCNGPADNGHDRSIPPSPYLCTKCMAEMPQPSYNVTVVDDAHPNGIPLEQWQNKPVAWRCACGANLYIGADGAPRSKAESVEPVAVSVDALAQHIRFVDGNNNLGAGILAEKIVEFLIKLGIGKEQAEPVEPVAYREDIIRMAREAASEDGSIDRKDGKNVVLYAAKTSRFLERLAALAAAAEREACAKVCDDKAKETFSGQCQVWGDYFARVIRARSNT